MTRPDIEHLDKVFKADPYSYAAGSLHSAWPALRDHIKSLEAHLSNHPTADVCLRIINRCEKLQARLEATEKALAADGLHLCSGCVGIIPLGIEACNPCKARTGSKDEPGYVPDIETVRVPIHRLRSLIETYAEMEDWEVLYEVHGVTVSKGDIVFAIEREVVD